MKFRSCDGRRVDLPVDGSRWTALIEAGEGAFAFGRETEGEETYRTIMIHMPYTAKHESIHTLRIVKQITIMRTNPETGEDVADHVIPAPGENLTSDKSWGWDGNEDRPTLNPSIACGPEEERDWHGYMSAGQLEACE